MSRSREFLVAFWTVMAIGLPFVAMTSSADAATPGQRLAEESAEWIGVTVKAPPIYQELVPAWMPSAYVLAEQSNDRPGQTRILPTLYWSWDRAARGMEPGYWTDEAAATVLHELVHRGGLTWDFDPYLEEGITEAVTQDLLPAWSRRFLGRTILPCDIQPSYPRQVAYIRHQSAIATGEGWRTRSARLWRRAFLLAGRSERLAMIP